jgi:hypothetical protein
LCKSTELVDYMIEYNPLLFGDKLYIWDICGFSTYYY